jgi:hypothetical protein
MGFLRLSIAAFQKMSSPTPWGYFKCGVESNNVRRGLVIYLDVMFFNITRRKTSRPILK